MDPQDAIELGREALMTAMLIGAPVLLVGIVVGLLIGLLQALTQIQDQTIAFVPKIIAMVITVGFCLPWLIERMVEYSEEVITNIPRMIMGGWACATVTAFLQLYLDQFLLFVLVLTRVSGLVMTAPIYGARSIPLQIRAFLAVALALLIAPLQDPAALELPSHLLGLLLLSARELVLGLALGLAVMILFTGLQLAGQLIGQISGMSLADVFDPTFQANIPVFTQLLDLVTLAVFTTIGGHRQVMRGLLDSFRWRPPGGLDLPAELFDTLAAVLAESFLVGIRAGAPVLVAVMLSVLILGLISRTLPQLNILAVGFSLNSLIMLTALAFSLSTIAWVVQERAEVIVAAVRAALQ